MSPSPRRLMKLTRDAFFDAAFVGDELWVDPNGFRTRVDVDVTVAVVDNTRMFRFTVMWGSR